MGSMALSNHYRSEDLLDIETAAGGFQQRKGMRQCLPLTFCFHTGLSQYMALESTEGRTCSEIFYHCPVRVLSLLSSSPYCKNDTLYNLWFPSFLPLLPKCLHMAYFFLQEGQKISSLSSTVLVFSDASRAVGLDTQKSNLWHIEINLSSQHYI